MADRPAQISRHACLTGHPGCRSRNRNYVSGSDVMFVMEVTVARFMWVCAARHVFIHVCYCYAYPLFSVSGSVSVMLCCNFLSFGMDSWFLARRARLQEYGKILRYVAADVHQAVAIVSVVVSLRH